MPEKKPFESSPSSTRKVHDFRALLEETVRQALLEVPAHAEGSLALQPEFAAISLGPGSKIAALRDLVGLYPPVAMQISTGHSLGGGLSVPLRAFHFASWLAFLAKRDGVSAAVDRFLRYGDDAFVPYHLVLALAGLKVSEVVALGSGIELVPWAAVPDSEEREMISAPDMRWMSPILPDSALIVRGKRPKWPGDAAVKANAVDLMAERGLLMQAVVALAIATPVGFERAYLYQAADEMVPFFSGGLNSFQIHRPNDSSTWDANWTSPVTTTVEGLMLLAPELSAQISRIAFRLSSARCNSGSAVDRWTNIGIAMEGLYLSGDTKATTEITYRLSMRAARFHVGTVDERIRLRKQIQKAYDYRSAAVHRGEAPKVRKGSMETRECLSEVATAVAAACCRIVKEGRLPDWDRLLLSSSD